MSVDIEAMSPEARAHYRRIGARYTTQDVLAQADMTMHGLSLYGPLLIPCGFGDEDAQDFAAGREDLRAQESDGGLVATDRKVISQNASDTLDKAKLRRQASITILTSALRVLRQRGNTTAMALVQKTLKETGALDEDAQLPTHLALLQAALEDPAVAEVVASRGGPASAIELTALQPAVRTAKSDRTEHPALAAAAERRDILDGFVVTLARTARDASRIAARLHGQPAIAAAFELVHLRRKPSRKPASPDTPAPADPVTTPEPPATALPGNPVTASE
jgi:hypothetical protein